jgi:ribosomal-protein-alanine N-acetyltransferase
MVKDSVKTSHAEVKNLPKQNLSVAGHPDISLRLIGLDDVEEFYRVMTIGGSNLDKYQYWDKGLTPEGIKAEVERSVGEIQKDKMLRYEVINHDSQRIIGEVSFYDHDEAAKTAYFGYLITAEFEGRGITSAASKSLIEYATDRWDLKKILLEIEVGNEISEHIATKFGAHPTKEIKTVKGGDKMRSMRIWEIINE